MAVQGPVVPCDVSFQVARHQRSGIMFIGLRPAVMHETFLSFSLHLVGNSLCGEPVAMRRKWRVGELTSVEGED
jgi:hypothetical protein